MALCCRPRYRVSLSCCLRTPDSRQEESESSDPAPANQKPPHSDPDQGPINVYSARGMLIQSDHAHFWATAVHHNVMYQYQLSSASNIFMGLLDAESPYFQPEPQESRLFEPGLFANDPLFESCITAACRMAWHLRIIDSDSVYALGAVLTTWFSNRDSSCLSTSCQSHGFQVIQSYSLWVYGLVTKGLAEMVSPFSSTPTLAITNPAGGVVSSILAWLQGSQTVTGPREWEGFFLHTVGELEAMGTMFSSTCSMALTSRIVCHDTVASLAEYQWRGGFGNRTLTDEVCHLDCLQSLIGWVSGVETHCADVFMDDGAPASMVGRRMLQGRMETCLKDTNSGRYCNGQSITITQLVFSN